MNQKFDILKEYNILYLEDDKNLLKHTSDVLEDFVNNIYSVKNSCQALEVLKTKKVDVIVCDILLENENGIDFLKSVKQNNFKIPSILTTAHTDTKYLIDAIKLKVENYIIKPIDINELLDTLLQILQPIHNSKEFKKNSNVIKIISAITDSKQVEVVRYIMNNLDNDNNFNAPYSKIMEQISISKPTLIKLFKELADKNILIKNGYKSYKFNENAL